MHKKHLKEKKRFHHGAKSAHHHVKHVGEEVYAGKDGRRAMERHDFHMISEDHNATANLPQEVMYHAWPTARHYVDYGLDDTIRGIDKQENEDNARMERHLQPGKY